MKLSEDVSYITLCKPLPLVLHAYVWPFVLAYLSLVSVWFSLYGFEESLEVFFLCLAVIAAINIITCLFCVWSVHVRCALTCKKVDGVAEATLVKVVPTPNNGYAELVSLVKQKHKVTREDLVWFIFQKIKYIYQEGKFQPVEFPINDPYQEYHKWKGYESLMQVSAAEQRFGKNKLDMTLPDFWSLFQERATAPFFVFQVFCVGLWCLDEFWYYSLFTLSMLVIFEVVLVKQQQRNLSEIRKMGAQPFTIQVYREGKWTKMSTDQLLPGDLVSIGRSKSGDLVPCDILLLKGSCIVDEAMLTGESVPQMKEPLSLLQETLDLTRDSRLHVLNGGTKIVQHTPPSKSDRDGIKLPESGCLGYVLRTGFNTNQGKLLRTILFGVKRVTANNLETFIFILFLLVFAIMAAAYVWVYGTVNPERNRYKLFLECTLILTSVVPPELPIELSLAVNTSLIALTKVGIFCTEPFRIPFAGKVDVCCFDKTGTLTSDNLVVQGVAGVEGSSGGEDERKVPIVSASDTPFETQCVLASCQSLALLDGEVVGDPLEKACLSAINWTINKGDTVSPRKGRKTVLNICQRFHFASALKRMSTVCAMQSASAGPAHLITVKGAPEVLQDMFRSVPEGYETMYTKLTRQGARVLALGYRQMGSLSQREVYALKREDVERELTFAGLVVISCPLKEDSKRNVRCLHDSSHHVVMLTGDNPLTACHVAKELKITTRKVLVLTATEGDQWVWQSVGGARKAAMDTKPAELGEKYDLCLAGDGLTHLLRAENKQLFRSVLPYIKVFARVAPKQKEGVVTSYKALGYVTLMCGDGTNDVGALKHADVGVALLSTVAMSNSNKEGTSTDPATLARRPLHPALKEPPKPLTPQQQREKRLKDLMAKMNEAEPQLVRLGDASIASPFTYKHSSIACICHVIKQGRCTLVTTLQMFKILALNALILAYSQSVLYLDGIKFSDFQATLQGLLLAGCFLCISRSKPLQVLSKERPLPTIFNMYMFLTVILQFVVHFSCLVFLVGETKASFTNSTAEEEDIDLEKEFEQNELNSAVYLISMAMQISNFAVNYKGHPFMASLRENGPLLISIFVSTTIVLIIASDIMPDLSATFEIVSFTPEPLPLVLHAYVRPFVLAYLSLVSVWFSLYGFEESLEVFFLCLAVIAAINSSTDLERNPHRQKSKLIPDVTLQTATIVKKIGKEVSDWNSDDVCEWLEDLEMTDYCQAFREEEVDGKQLVKPFPMASVL